MLIINHVCSQSITPTSFLRTIWTWKCNCGNSEIFINFTETTTNCFYKKNSEPYLRNRQLWPPLKSLFTTTMVDEQKLAYVPSNWSKCGQLCQVFNSDELLEKWVKFNSIPKVNANYKPCLLSVDMHLLSAWRPPPENAIVITQKRTTN